MALLAAGCMSIAVLSMALAIPSHPKRSQRRWIDSLLDRSRERLAQARITGSPRTYLALLVLAPPVLFVIGWLQSPVLALAGAVVGLLMPRMYVVWLIHAQSRRSEA